MVNSVLQLFNENNSDDKFLELAIRLRKTFDDWMNENFNTSKIEPEEIKIMHHEDPYKGMIQRSKKFWEKVRNTFERDVWIRVNDPKLLKILEEFQFVNDIIKPDHAISNLLRKPVYELKTIEVKYKKTKSGRYCKSRYTHFKMLF